MDDLTRFFLLSQTFKNLHTSLRVVERVPVGRTEIQCLAVRRPQRFELLGRLQSVVKRKLPTQLSYSDRMTSARSGPDTMVVRTTTGNRGRDLPASASRWTPAVAVFVVLNLLCLGQTVAKRKHHWKADVIKNHLKNHKSLEGMVRLVDGGSQHEGTGWEKSQKCKTGVAESTNLNYIQS